MPSTSVSQTKLHRAMPAIAGALVAIFALWAFIGIAGEVPEQDKLVRADVAIAQFVERTNTEVGETFFSGVSWLGAGGLFVLAACAVAAFAHRRDWFRASATALTLGSGTVLNYALKDLFQRGRPEFAAEFIHAPSWSFPSGHAMNSVIGYGFLLLLALEHTRDARRRRLLVAGALLLVIMIGFSRMYLGVHFMTDIVAGYLAGTVWLLVCIACYRFEQRRTASRST